MPFIDGVLSLGSAVATLARQELEGPSLHLLYHGLHVALLFDCVGTATRRPVIGSVKQQLLQCETPITSLCLSMQGKDPVGYVQRLLEYENVIIRAFADDKNFRNELNKVGSSVRC